MSQNIVVTHVGLKYNLILKCKLKLVEPTSVLDITLNPTVRACKFKVHKHNYYKFSILMQHKFTWLFHLTYFEMSLNVNGSTARRFKGLFNRYSVIFANNKWGFWLFSAVRFSFTWKVIKIVPLVCYTVTFFQ